MPVSFDKYTAQFIMNFLMNRRPFHIIWLLFISLWFGVIAPGHTRGVIKLSGTEQEQGQPDSCCVRPIAHPADSTKQDSSDSQKHPPVDSATGCAVCYLNSILDTPDKPVFVTFCTGLLTELEPLEPLGLSSILVHLLAHIRGPPALAY